VERLKLHFEAMLAMAERGDLRGLNEEDRAFHDTLIELSRHSLLMSTWKMVALRVRQVMALLNERNTQLRQIALNHLPIIEAISDGDEERAVALIEKHIAATGELIAEGWDDDESEGTW